MRFLNQKLIDRDRITDDFKRFPDEIFENAQVFIHSCRSQVRPQFENRSNFSNKTLAVC